MRDSTILIVEDDSIICHSLADFLEIKGFSVQVASNLKTAHMALQKERVAIVLLDLHLPDGNGIHLVGYIREHYPNTSTIVITGHGSIDNAVHAIKTGASDYLTKPLIDDELMLAIEETLKASHTPNQTADQRLTTVNSPLQAIVTRDHKMARVFEIVNAVANTDTTLLMTGPSGTGKSMLARAIHQCSERANGPFVEVSCGALTETLLESELFGHARGAFTGAVREKIGKFLLADQGTIFLDEIGTATPGLQVKLLRILEERTFEPVGSTTTHAVNARILLATNLDLEHEVTTGRFRADLYYRINVVTIDMPALRDRRHDIPLLATHFLELYASKHKRPQNSITSPAITALQRYTWPGNIRELENVIERAVLLSKGPEVQITDLPISLQCVQQAKANTHKLKDVRIEPEKRLILAALEANHWNRQKTAQALGINRTTLYKKIKRYGLQLPV